MARGIRNHNPGNIRHGSDWRGRVEVKIDSSFCTFLEPLYGLRALARLLRVYHTRHKLETIREIISRWAPPNENDTDAYVRSVAKKLDVEPDEPIDLTNKRRMMQLMAAIIHHENGEQPYAEVQLADAIRLEKEE